MKRIITIAFLIIAFISSANAQDKSYLNNPGYVDFGSFSGLEESENVVEIQLEAPILRLVAKMSEEDDEELSDLLEGLKLIKVYAFDATKKTQPEFVRKIKRLNGKLLRKGWQRIVKAKDKNDYVNIYIRTDGDSNIVGLVIMAVDNSGSVAFVNIVGNINLETIGRLSEKFDIPELDKIDEADSAKAKNK